MNARAGKDSLLQKYARAYTSVSRHHTRGTVRDIYDVCVFCIRIYGIFAATYISYLGFVYASIFRFHRSHYDAAGCHKAHFRVHNTRIAYTDTHISYPCASLSRGTWWMTCGWICRRRRLTAKFLFFSWMWTLEMHSMNTRLPAGNRKHMTSPKMWWCWAAIRMGESYGCIRF